MDPKTTAGEVAGSDPMMPETPAADPDLKVIADLVLLSAVAVAKTVTDGTTPVAFATSRVESSTYADFTLTLPGPRTVRIRY
jgi:hypothetical protein